MGAPGKEHLIPENTFIYLLQFNGKRFYVSDKYKGISIRTVYIKESKTPYKTDHFLKNIHIIKTKIKHVQYIQKKQSIK